MVKLQSVRALLSPDQNRVLKEVLSGRKTIKEAAIELGDTEEEVEKAVLYYKKHIDTSGYSADVNKMISFKGTIRELFLKVRNKHGGTYPLKVINLYMKPGTQRYYDKGVISVDKDKIRRGSESEGYHPDKTMWIDQMPRRVRPKTAKPSTPLEGTGPEGEIVLRKKGKSKHKVTLRKKVRKCVCKRKK
jgi:hypothetical protein